MHWKFQALFSLKKKKVEKKIIRILSAAFVMAFSGLKCHILIFASKS